MSNSSSLQNGVEVIKSYQENMPKKPGVYRMLGENDEVLYVGKAKNLPKRVVSYTRPEKLPYRLQRMISLTIKMEFATTETEAEALLLEANLIKKLKPRFNILLRDDKTYPYIFIDKNHDYPRITKHRGEKKRKGEYFGPFPSAGAVNNAISDLQKSFLIRPCTDSYFSGRDRPCIEYQIKRCSAPCVEKISKEDYANLISQATNFLKGKSRDLQEQLASEMQEASDALQFEKAAIIRDRINALNQIQAKQRINLTSLKDADIIGMYREENSCAIQVFFFRAGQNLGNRAYFPSQIANSSDEEIISAFIGQFYQTNPPPGQIYISHKLEEADLIEKALMRVVDYKVALIHPEKGDKKKLVENAIANAEQSLAQNQAKHIRRKELMLKLGKLFGLEAAPQRIEVYDNSHIMGSQEVGAMIVADSDGFNKNEYRKFNIKSSAKNKGDDYAMMREVMLRRFSRLKDEIANGNKDKKPDLVLIDGGPGHLSVVSDVFKELQIMDLFVYACIAKGPERNKGKETFYMYDTPPFKLDDNDPVLHHLQILRDEAHRFAIGSHRKKRSKETFHSSLDDIPGIGTKRKKALLKHFGSIKAIKSASIEEIAKVEGVNTSLAAEILEHL